MGAHPYWYFVPYNDDTQQALDDLRERERTAGRYNPVTHFPDFPIEPGEEWKVNSEDSWSTEYEDEMGGEDGARSILDIQSIGGDPDYGVAAPVHGEMLQSLYGTRQPTRAMIEGNMGFFEALERGHAVFIVVYKDGEPDELFFGGYSFD